MLKLCRAVTVTQKQKMINRKTIIKVMKTITIVVNIALYVFFVVIVLVFHFSTSNSSTTQCGGRVVTPLNDSQQKNISVGNFSLKK